LELRKVVIQVLAIFSNMDGSLWLFTFLSSSVSYASL